MNNPLVVGYKGEIGSFILAGLLRYMPKASNIWCVDINDEQAAVKERIDKSDVIFLCLPMKDTVDFLATWRRELKGKFIIEQTSLKSVVYDDGWYKMYKNEFTLFSMHVLFKPSGTPNKEDRVTALIDHPFWRLGPEYLNNIIADITQSRLIYFHTWQDHDASMALEQALVHRVLINLDTFLGTSNTFMAKRVKELAFRIKSGNTELYKTIQTNPRAVNVLAEFGKSLKDFKL